MAAFAALLALPLLTLAVPGLPIPGAGAVLAPQVVFRADARPTAETLQASAPFGLEQNQVHRTAPAAPPRTDWRILLTLLWAAGAAAAFLQMIAGVAYMHRLRSRSRALPGDDLLPLAGSLGIRHRVGVFETAPGRMPVSFGMLRPAVFMPADSAAWSDERRRVVLLHELAHVRRGDHAMHLLARAALCLYWWNPLAWAAWRAFLKERERAADDLVLAAGARASDYAAHLLEIARAMRSAPALGAAAVAVARRSQLEGRLLAILDAGRNRRSPGRAGAMAAALICAAVVIPLAALQAQDSSQALPADIDAAVRAALAQRNQATLESLAKTAEAQRRFDLAEEALVGALGMTPGPSSLEYGKGLVKLAQVQQKGGSIQATETYRKAVAVLGSDPAAGPALIGLGVASMTAKRFDEAFDHFQHAQAISPATAAEAVMWQAVVRERQNRAQEAEPLYKLALSIAAPNTAEPATIMELYAKNLDRQGRLDEAREMRDKAVAIRKAIPPATAQFTRPKAQAQAGADGLNTIVSSQIGIPAPPPPPPPPAAAPGAASSPNQGELRVGGYVPPSGSVMTPPKLISKVEPEYSETARAAKYQGTVVLKVDIVPDGTAQNISVQRSLGLGLEEKAIEAVRKWRFQPGTRDGQPVTTTSTIEVNFRLLADPPPAASTPAGQAAIGQAVPDNGVFRVGGGVTAPKLILKVEPEYTEEARLAAYDGTVILYVEIGTNGLAQSIKVTRGLGLGLDEKAVEAVSKWRFEPGTRFGVPVPVAATIEVNFRLL